MSYVDIQRACTLYRASNVEAGINGQSGEKLNKMRQRADDIVLSLIRHRDDDALHFCVVPMNIDDS